MEPIDGSLVMLEVWDVLFPCIADQGRSKGLPIPIFPREVPFQEGNKIPKKELLAVGGVKEQR